MEFGKFPLPIKQLKISAFETAQKTFSLNMTQVSHYVSPCWNVRDYFFKIFTESEEIEKSKYLCMVDASHRFSNVEETFKLYWNSRKFFISENLKYHDKNLILRTTKSGCCYGNVFFLSRSAMFRAKAFV